MPWRKPNMLSSRRGENREWSEGKAWAIDEGKTMELWIKTPRLRPQTKKTGYNHKTRKTKRTTTDGVENQDED